jgi:Domain of unknown function (DUF4932)
MKNRAWRFLKFYYPFSNDNRKKYSVLRNMVTFIGVLVFQFNTLAQENETALVPKVDKRIELMNIMYQLAKYGEATDTFNPQYTKAINAHFSPFKNLPTISYVKNLIEKYEKDSINMNDWELPSLAVHLTQPPELKPLVDNEKRDNSDSWDDRSLLTTEFVTFIKDFYQKSNAEIFFKKQESYYNNIQKNYLKQGIIIQKQWINTFFRLKPTETYFPILSLSPTMGAYLRVNFKDNERNTYTIFGCSKYDNQGMPLTFQEPYFAWSILHEYIHCFSNQVIEHDTSTWKSLGEKLLSNPKVFDLVKGTFYGNWRYLLYESLVRATSIRYAIAHNESTEKVELDIKKQEMLGFFWMKDLVNQLGEYENNRKKYKKFSEFMPELIQAFEKYAVNK